MGDRIFVLSQDEMRSGSFLPPQMIEDMLAIASVSSGAAEHLSLLLESDKGILTASRLNGLVSECVDDDRQAAAIYTALQNIRPDKVQQAVENVDKWRKASEQNLGRMGDEVFAALQRNLLLLIRDLPSLKTLHKANQLQGVLGKELESVKFICDARPAFNESRERIEGLLPITTLKLAYECQDGDPQVIELVVSEEVLKDLISKAQEAQQKLSVINTSIENWMK